MIADGGKKSALRRSTWIRAFAVLVVLGAALYVVHGELQRYVYHDISRAILALPVRSVLIALAFTVIAYSILPAYDAIALRYIGKPLPVHRLAFGSLISYGLSHTLGLAPVTGGSVRYRFWSAWGLSTTEVAQAVSFVGATFAIGMIFLGGVVFLLEPADTMKLLGLPYVLIRVVGVLLLALVGGYVAWSALRRTPITIRGWRFPVPSPALVGRQLIVATIDWTAAGAVLYALVGGHGFGFPAFLGAFLLAQFAGQLSHVPGGIGVFESLMLLFLKPHVPATTALAALVAYRVIYYLLPFGIALVLLASYEVIGQRKRVVSVATAAGTFAARWVPVALPQALATTIFLAGVMLLFSGATPGVRARLAQLDEVLPLGLIELFHFAGSIAGAGLIVLAWGLSRRLDSAYRLTVGLLVLGVAASILKGLDWEEALVLIVVLAAVLPSRRAFYRKAALTSEPLEPAWIVALTVVMGATLWLGLFSYKHIEFSNELWLRFSRHGDAPRFMRAMLGSAGVMVVFFMTRLMRHAEAEPEPPTDEEIARAKRILASSPQTGANLVLLRDKSLLFSDSGNAMLMYGVEGRSWIALGDPIGPDDEVTELAWHFREEADRHGAWTVFYEVSTQRLPLYIDLGLTLLKLGEEAIVHLENFSLAGAARKGLRRVLGDARKDGAEFEIAPAERVPSLMPDLKRISDEWLSLKKTREKGFSLGRFDERYLLNFPVALVRCSDEIVAFANVWCAADHRELSGDLMRYSSRAPRGVMDYLFIELMTWGKEQGYERFNLGMAPLSGLESRALAPIWNRAGALIFRQGEQFYNFRGLRQYKEKFDPVWEPRYLASPGGLVLPRVLANTTALISGGLRGAVAR